MLDFFPTQLSVFFFLLLIYLHPFESHNYDVLHPEKDKEIQFSLLSRTFPWILIQWPKLPAKRPQNATGLISCP